MEPSFRPVELSFPIPRHPHLKCHAHLTFLNNCSMIHLTTSDMDMPTPQAPMGSFVYAMPDRMNTRTSISTALSTSAPSIEYATRLAKILARKLEEPVYVGCSMNLAGVTVEEEMEGLKEIVERVIKARKQAQ